MRLHAPLFACAISLLAGCSSYVRPPVTPAQPPTQEQREMATLSFLAYLGDGLVGSDEWVEKHLDHCMEKALWDQVDVRHWELAWGPAVYHFSLGVLDDNMMYVVRDRNDPAHLVVVVRGTNAASILDWLVEDFDVFDQVSWPTAPPPGLPKTSKAISEGLHILQTKTTEGGPVKKRHLSDFLQSQVNQYSSGPPASGLLLDVTGHSLGGALAPVLALWLSETLTGNVRIRVFPLAGPSPGNADFAAYYDRALGSSTRRLWNPFDIVPLAWNHASMGKMADLYEPFTGADLWTRGAIDGARLFVEDYGYAQLKPGQDSLPGAVYTQSGTDWWAEVEWQHSCGYQCAFGISVLTSVPGCPSNEAQYPCPTTACPQR
jgi:hypothetical protein